MCECCCWGFGVCFVRDCWIRLGDVQEMQECWFSELGLTSCCVASFDDDGSMPSSLQGLACIYNDVFVTPLWPRPQE